MIEDVTLTKQPLLDLATAKTLTSITATPGMYYRSRVFSAKCGVNKLITAAQPILALLSQLRLTTKPPQHDQLLENLAHEFLTFEAHATTSKYDKDVVTLARFLLCVAIDECIVLSPWFEEWKGPTPFQYFYQKDKTKDSFFTIIEKLLQAADKHLDLLEMAYICLNLGFAKTYKHSSNGRLTLSPYQDQLYKTIRSFRGDKHIQLYLKPHIVPHEKKSQLNLSLKKIIYLAIACFAFIYFSYGYIIKVNYDLLPKHLKDDISNPIAGNENDNN